MGYIHLIFLTAEFAENAENKIISKNISLRSLRLNFFYLSQSDEAALTLADHSRNEKISHNSHGSPFSWQALLNCRRGGVILILEV